MGRVIARCFVCGVSELRRVILRFGLDVPWKGKRVSAGGMFLCERCWREARAIDGRRGSKPRHARAVRRIDRHKAA